MTAFFFHLCLCPDFLPLDQREKTFRDSFHVGKIMVPELEDWFKIYGNEQG
jgi:hypothetical protein